MEYFEIMDTNFAEIAAWEAFEEDYKTNPWSDAE